MYILKPGQLDFHDLAQLLEPKTKLALDPTCHQPIMDAKHFVDELIRTDQVVYGINTGFGALANTRIPRLALEQLQYNLVVSHAAGVGELLSDQVVRLILILKINSLARGYSGVDINTIELLIKLFNAQIYPCIPAQGSVGASGDLAPLAHLSLVLLGLGQAAHQGQHISGAQALKRIKTPALKLAPKEGLALLNGTQVSTALALVALFKTEELFFSALAAGALTIEATQSSDSPFDPRIQAIKGHATQTKVAMWLKALLADRPPHDTHNIQDPYSLRCMPQVMGACLKQIEVVKEVLLTEANAVSDNPLVFAKDKTILSGGNFHAEPVALAADALAVCIAEIGALSERRTALLMDAHFSRLPAFVIPDPGIHSGFMMAHVTAAALASENKSLAHPASVDSLPTSANQEDHVSMATFAARRLLQMTENTANIISIELLAASEGVDLHACKHISPKLRRVHQLIRNHVPYYDSDRVISPDIGCVKELILSGEIRGSIKEWIVEP
jgi:histidine ammonia-lyase